MTREEVAPLAGSVGRNCVSVLRGNGRKRVAPLAGSVGRNSDRLTFGLSRECRSPRGERG